MKEKIQLLSKGVFDYENPNIEVSETSLLMDIESGSRYEGCLNVISRNHVEIRAEVFTSGQQMQCRENSIIGENCEIHYCFDSSALEAGETAEGYIYIVSNGGEITIPYRARIQPPYADTSTGRINDLDQFAQLARENWSEALKIFCSPDFKNIFLNDKRNRRTYDALMRGEDPSQAMEEFLCTSRRKKTVRITVSQDRIECEDIQRAVNGRLMIEKNTWGRVRIRVSFEGDFLTIYKHVITEEDFLGSYYQLEYEVRPGSLITSTGKIILDTFDQHVEIPVLCTRIKRKEGGVSGSHIVKKSWLDLNRIYISMQLDRISREQALTEARQAVDGCVNNSKDSIYRVVEAHYLVMSGSPETAGNILDRVNGRELRYRSAVDYCYYLYVNAKRREDDQYTDYVRDTIRFYAEGQCRDRWEPAYMLMLLNNDVQKHPASALAVIRRAYEGGMPGGCIFAEAAKIISNDPSLIREMDGFTVSLMLWGVRHDCFGRDVIMRFADLASRMKSCHVQCMNTLMGLCRIYETKNLLTAVLHLLILGDKREQKYHEWYELGIRSAIRMPGLYEYFMASLDIKTCTWLPESVLIYFQFDNQLDEEQKAFLYRYVIEHREEYGRISDAYSGIIEAFALEELRNGKMSADLSVLYNYYLRSEEITSYVVRMLPDVIFKQQVYCAHSGVRSVIVDYAESDRERVYPVTGGYAYVDIFMDDYRLMFADENGGRHMASVEYGIKRLMDPAKYVRECYEQCGDNEMILMNRSERALKYQIVDDASIRTYTNVLRLDDVSLSYRKSILNSLIDYYYDNYEGETLEKYLLQIDLRLLDGRERCHIIEYFIQRGLYQRAYDAVTTYGPYGIQDKRIMRLTSRMIREKNFEEDSMLISLAYLVFSKGKYDETILEYLVDYYTGTVSNMLSVWISCAEFEVPADGIEDRILSTALFAETMVAQTGDVFASYYNRHQADRIVKAYLSYYSYHFLLGDAGVRDEVFRIMEIELDMMDQSRDTCSMALLKYYAGLDHIPAEYLERLRGEVAGFMDRGMFLPFFKKFMGTAEVPEELADAVYTEYHTGPGHTVKIFYRIPGGENTEFCDKIMKQVFPGIYISMFRLYGPEELEYYITDSGPDKTIKTGMMTAGQERKREGSPLTGMDQVNRMYDYLDFHDDLRLDNALRDYERLDRLSDVLFDLK